MQQSVTNVPNTCTVLSTVGDTTHKSEYTHGRPAARQLATIARSCRKSRTKSKIDRSIHKRRYTIANLTLLVEKDYPLRGIVIGSIWDATADVTM